jgi:hypothetical protein
MKYLPSDLEPIEMGETWLRYRVSHPDRVNPKVLHAMAQAGVQVITLSEVERSLEDVYLQVVGGNTSPEGEL